MLLKITEYCAWEREKWSYIFDMDKQYPEAINFFMQFQRLANEQFEIVKANAEAQPPPIALHPIFNPYPVYVFAASRYLMEFYEKLVERKGRYYLINGGRDLSLSTNSGYQSATNIMLDRIICPKKMEVARNKIRDKKENKLYKDFQSCLYAKKKEKIS